MYGEEEVGKRRKRRKQVGQTARRSHVLLEARNQRWSMDFIAASLPTGCGFRTLKVVDDNTRQYVAIEVDTSLSSECVTRVLDRMMERRGKPESLGMNNDREFAGKAIDAWAHQHHIRLAFIGQGRLIENCFVESFNGKPCDECLNQHWFTSPRDARLEIEAWPRDYNRVRPAARSDG